MVFAPIFGACNMIVHLCLIGKTFFDNEFMIHFLFRFNDIMFAVKEIS